MIQLKRYIIIIIDRVPKQQKRQITVLTVGETLSFWRVVTSGEFGSPTEVSSSGWVGNSEGTVALL